MLGEPRLLRPETDAHASNDSIVRLRAKRHHDARMGLSMARAFHQEPNFTYLLPNERQRQRALEWFFGSFLVRLGLRYGEVYTTPDGAGGAVWMRPGASATAWGALHAGLLTMPLLFGLRGTRRSTTFGAYVEHVRRKTAPAQHWYLVALGVAPSQQRRGLGAALIEPSLARADEQGTPCYLETFLERTAAFYARFGFTVSRIDAIPRGGPAFWCMTRPIESRTKA